jgi:hypothetical protein
MTSGKANIDLCQPDQVPEERDGSVARISCRLLGLCDVRGDLHYCRCRSYRSRILGLPGRIAVARKHPETDAVYLMGWIGFLAVVPWIQALGWAFKPTTVIDVRYLPEERRTETEATIAKLTGNSPAADTAPATQQAESAP